MNRMKTARFLLFQILLVLLLQLIVLNVSPQTVCRKEINIPNILGYITLKCDFHMHTVFSDGKVWPTVRVDEAWREGLDAIAITEHVEIQSYADDIPKNLNRPHEIAVKRANELGIILIKGAEITRKEMPPGHFNAIFVKDINALDKKDWREAVKAAIDQGAFVFWNHPGWPTGKSIWYPEHEEVYKKGWIKGIEVVNEYEFYPEAIEWCLSKNLTMLGNSDVHDTIHLAFDLQKDGHRPLTLVFAKERTEEAIKDALLSQRTVVYWKNMLIGHKKYLEEIYRESVKILSKEITPNEHGYFNLVVSNSSDINYILIPDGEINKFDTIDSITIPANSISHVTFRVNRDKLPKSGEVVLPFVIQNLITSPGQGLRVDIKLPFKL